MTWHQPDWSVWPSREAVTLEQFVALSLAAEPEVRSEVTYPLAPRPTREEYDEVLRSVERSRSGANGSRGELGAHAGGRYTWGAPWVSPDGMERLTRLRRAIKRGELPAGVRAAADAPLKWPLLALVQWAERAGWEMPAQLLETVRPRGQQPNDGREAAQAAATSEAKSRHAASDAPSSGTPRKNINIEAEAVWVSLGRPSGERGNAKVWLELLSRADNPRPGSCVVGRDGQNIRWKDGSANGAEYSRVNLKNLLRRLRAAP